MLVSGQGVVMNKCVLSDFVYMEAMCNVGYVSRGGELGGMSRTSAVVLD